MADGMPGGDEEATLTSTSARERAQHDHRRAVEAAEAPLAAMSSEVLRAAGLVNGLAAGATLFLLAAWARDRAGAIWLVAPLSLFGFGFATASFATGWSYLAAEAHAAALRAMALTAVAPFVSETPASREAAARSGRFAGHAFAAVLVAMAAAIVGFCVSGAVLIALLR